MNAANLFSTMRNSDGLTQRQRDAVVELVDRIAANYPETQFRLTWGVDDPETIYIVAESDLEDPDVVMDAVIDRLVDLQVEDDVQVGVLSVLTPERNAAIRAEQLLQQQERAMATTALT